MPLHHNRIHKTQIIHSTKPLCTVDAFISTFEKKNVFIVIIYKIVCK